ncbi:MAG: hydrolase [Candidatus Gracilibacteria bacterium]|jgi:hypothetical protein
MADTNNPQNTQQPQAQQSAPSPQPQTVPEPQQAPVQPAAESTPSSILSSVTNFAGSLTDKAKSAANMAQTVAMAGVSMAQTAAGTVQSAANKVTDLVSCKCPVIKSEDWDKKQVSLNKIFYKSISPRIFYVPFSQAIDVNRTRIAALAKGYKVAENPMVLTTAGIFFGYTLVELAQGNKDDKNVVSFEGKSLYGKVSKESSLKLKAELTELKKELAKEPKNIYVWDITCPKCYMKKEIKRIFLAEV